MYKRLYTFLDYNNIIYDLQFRFRQQYSTYHALINITYITKALICYYDLNDLNQAMKFCKVHHFADETNLLCWSTNLLYIYQKCN